MCLDEDIILIDDKVEKDTKVVEKICKISFKNNKKVILLMLKYHAANYYDMFDWDTELKTDSSFLTFLNDEEFSGIHEKPLSISKWPNHKQSAVRRIRVMIEICTEVATCKATNGYIRQQLSSICLCLPLEPKKHFNFIY